LLAACGALALACLSPALVEASRGRVARAGAAVIETFASPKTYVPPDAFARFRTRPGATARGAAAYFLSYFGLDVRESELPPGLEGHPSLAEIETFLAQHFQLPTQTIPLEAERMPRVAALVRLRDGSYGVLGDPSGEANPTWFVPTSALTVPVDRARFVAASDGKALIPR
ncbi:MAG TPA: hypothetical protein VGK73_27775, partial [Polyangiaceae bacterium]